MSTNDYITRFEKSCSYICNFNFWIIYTKNFLKLYRVSNLRIDGYDEK